MEPFMFSWSRYLACCISLGIGETILNWGNWQYAPLWIVDYFIAFGLLLGFRVTRNGTNANILQSAWAFTCGIFYMPLFVNLDQALD
jgi:hypothetical protein